MADSVLYDKFGCGFKNGEIIFNEGEEGDKVYIIQEGAVKISKIVSDRENIIDVLKKGDFFGEMAIVSCVKRTATASAVGDVKLLSFNRKGFEDMIGKNTKIAMNIIDKLCERLDIANRKIQLLRKRDIKAIVGENFYYYYKSLSGDELRDISFDSVCRILGKNLDIPSGTVEEQMKIFADEGIIKIHDDKIVVEDLEKFHI